MLDFWGIENFNQSNVKKKEHHNTVVIEVKNYDEKKNKETTEKSEEILPIIFIDGGIEINLSARGGIEALSMFYAAREYYNEKAR